MMSFQKLALFCLIAIAVGSVLGLLNVKLNPRESAFAVKRMEDVEIQSRVSASQTLPSEMEALMREKANGLGDFRAGKTDAE